MVYFHNSTGPRQRLKDLLSFNKDSYPEIRQKQIYYGESSCVFKFLNAVK